MESVLTRFNRPWCSSLNGIRASAELFIEIFFFKWSLHFTTFEPTNNNAPKKVYAISTNPLSPFETSPGDTWTQSLVTNFLNFNPRQYESNHHKHNLLITKSKISQCLLQLQTIKSQNFTLDQPVIIYSTNSPCKHTPTPHFQSKFSIF